MKLSKSERKYALEASELERLDDEERVELFAYLKGSRSSAAYDNLSSGSLMMAVNDIAKFQIRDSRCMAETCGGRCGNRQKFAGFCAIHATMDPPGEYY